MSKIELINGSCADQEVDAIVNAANRNLWSGGGICGVIFKKAGYTKLTDACRKIKTPLKDGESAITPAFDITNAKYLIHAVGPNFGATPNAFKELYEAYYSSLQLLKDNNLHSISFPLISSGIFGYGLDNPAGESTKQCLRAYNKFIIDNKDYDVYVKLCAFSQKEYLEAEKEFNNNMKYDELKNRIKDLDGIHCVIGDKYCSHEESGYIDEFYINAVSEDEIEVYYNKITYKYSSFDEMINAKLFNNESINDLISKIFFEDKKQ